MQLIEVDGNLFVAAREYVFVHCISANCEMGQGIAEEFVRRFPGMKPYLLSQNPTVGQAVLYQDISGRRVFNLVTKELHWHKPSYKTMQMALDDMARQMVSSGFRRVAMPKIGCGLDKLQWQKVKERVENTLPSDVQVVVFNLKK